MNIDAPWYTVKAPHWHDQEQDIIQNRLKDQGGCQETQSNIKGATWASTG